MLPFYQGPGKEGHKDVVMGAVHRKKTNTIDLTSRRFLEIMNKKYPARLLVVRRFFCQYLFLVCVKYPYVNGEVVRSSRDRRVILCPVDETYLKFGNMQIYFPGY